MNISIREQLVALADEEYRKFSAKLLPNVDKILGVRLPLLKNMAKKIAKEDWRSFLAAAQSDYHEEILLQGLVIGYVKADSKEQFACIAAFILLIQNWAACDSFCSGLKKFTQANKESMWDFLQPYLTSSQEYEIRFGVVMLLGYYIDEEYLEHVLSRLDHINHSGYYVKMAVAWAVSICYIKFPAQTMEYLQHTILDDFTYHKALQKIVESNRIDKATKTAIREMRRK